MQTVVGVRFKRAGKIYYFSPGKLEIETNDDVINVGATRAIITDIDNTKPVIAVNNINYLDQD